MCNRSSSSMLASKLNSWYLPAASLKRAEKSYSFAFSYQLNLDRFGKSPSAHLAQLERENSLFISR